MTDATLVTLWWCSWLFVSWCIGWHDLALMLLRRRHLGGPPKRAELYLWEMANMMSAVNELVRSNKGDTDGR